MQKNIIQNNLISFSHSGEGEKGVFYISKFEIYCEILVIIIRLVTEQLIILLLTNMAICYDSKSVAELEFQELEVLLSILFG